MLLLLSVSTKFKSNHFLYTTWKHVSAMRIDIRCDVFALPIRCKQFWYLTDSITAIYKQNFSQINRYLK